MSASLLDNDKLYFAINFHQLLHVYLYETEDDVVDFLRNILAANSNSGVWYSPTSRYGLESPGIYSHWGV